jgi:preprotein translocase subunit YajC
MYQRYVKDTAMIRKLGKTFALSCASLILGTTLAFAGGMKGTVTSIDDKGMATVKTEDGKEHKVKGEGWKVGAKVECDMKEGTTSCKAAM